MMATGEQAAQLRVDIALASRVVAPLWPISSFIAVNPLIGFVEAGFDTAIGEARRWFAADGYPNHHHLKRSIDEHRMDFNHIRAQVRAHLSECGTDCDAEVGVTKLNAIDLVMADMAGSSAEASRQPAARTVLERVDAELGTAQARRVDGETARWLAMLTNDGRWLESLTGQLGSAYGAWKEAARHDRRLSKLGGRSARRDLQHFPDRPETAILLALEILGVGSGDRLGEFRGQFARLPGWSGWAKWCDEWADNSDPAPRLSMVDLLAIRLTYDSIAARGVTPSGESVAVENKTQAGSVRSRALRCLATLGERQPGPEDLLWAESVLNSSSPSEYGRLRLLALEEAGEKQLLSVLRADAEPVEGPEAQIVFCIDPRSEGVRRHLEQLGTYDTIGFAGFFAVPMRFRPVGGTGSYPSAPVLLSPDIEVREVPAVGSEQEVQRRVDRAGTLFAIEGTFEAMAHAPLSMFALAEAGGWVIGPLALARTLHPRPARRMDVGETRLQVESSALGGFSLEERVLVAETALRTMGLTRSFAPLVVFCGHGSTSTANPHAAALDCGACGGNRGAPNARAAAAICNDPDVRLELRARGIDVPSSTWFLAAEHDTSTDTFSLFDVTDVPSSHQARAAKLVADLGIAGERNAEERVRRLPGEKGRAPGRRQARTRSSDWAEPRPEWGLVGNHAFVVGPRSMTRSVDLEGRCFLHSYDAAEDRDGTALETILTAPMVVAHWINAQYYFSTVDPEIFGSGDKTTHNPINGIGVLTGGGGDLRIGLPLQSVADVDGPVHEPVRLMTVIEAPRSRIDSVITRNPILRHLFGGSWVRLIARDTGGSPWFKRSAEGEWVRVTLTNALSEGISA